MTLFSFSKCATAAVAVFLASGIGIQSAHAFNEICNQLARQGSQATRDQTGGNNGIVGTQFVISAQECRNGYRERSPQDLLEGGCFNEHSPWYKCAATIKTWTALQTSTNRDCLQVWANVAFNPNEGNFSFLENISYNEAKLQYAYHLSRNDLFMETLFSIDQAELKKIGSRVTNPLK